MHISSFLKLKTKILLVVIACLLVGSVFMFLTRNPSVSETQNSNQSVSNEDITFTYPEDFKLTVHSEPILKKSYFPICGESFDYCLSYIGDTYKGTTFEGAGKRIQKRSDLNTSDLCLQTLPKGYTNLKPDIHSDDTYSTSTFAPLNDAGMGHYTIGELYRLSFANKCYEFEIRIGHTQFANYPTGTIREFTKTNQENMKIRLQKILNEIKLIGKK